MKAKLISLIIFLLAVIIQLLSQVFSWDMLSMVSKPVLMPALIAYFYYTVKVKEKIAFYLVMALFFSWLGDVLLIFQNLDTLYFIIGLVSFLTAHVLYIIIFRKTNDDFKPKTFTYATGFLLIVFGGLLLMLLWPGLGEMKIPVTIYTLVIIVMGLAALFRKAEGSSLILIGAMLFITSDSLLAINKFNTPVLGANIWIMATYILAQYFIIAGMINYFTNREV